MFAAEFKPVLAGPSQFHSGPFFTERCPLYVQKKTHPPWFKDRHQWKTMEVKCTSLLVNLSLVGFVLVLEIIHLWNLGHFLNTFLFILLHCIGWQNGQRSISQNLRNLGYWENVFLWSGWTVPLKQTGRSWANGAVRLLEIHFLLGPFRFVLLSF